VRLTAVGERFLPEAWALLAAEERARAAVAARSVELKRELVKQITDAFVDAYRIPAETVTVWIQDVPTDSWGAAGTLTADK
jgi:4-oxalocrotonate tautomerase